MPDVTLLLLAACARDPVLSETGDPDPHLTFLVVDNGLSEVSRVDTRGTGAWTTELGVGGPRDLALVDDDTVLVSTSEGAMWLSLADGAIERTLGGFADVQTARPLSNGHVLLGSGPTEGGDTVVFTEVDGDGAVVGELTLAGYSDLRLVRVLDDGHLLFTGGKDGWHAFEVGADGAEVWSAPLPGKGYLAERLSNGLTLATTGEDVEVVALDAAGAQTRTWGGREQDPELAEEAFFSGFSIIGDDHVAVANWHGHDLTQGGPHVIVYGADGTRTWEWESEDVLMCTNVLVLEAVEVDELDAG